ncbi:hypothetical protein U732_462 [Clostridium argentinense CDC 2741]|uniref:Uncharacterized protein n=1 Tax=Clostridium argentinense CDC 2741 TaxID=1418104 RepID=A0A0C1TU65_9CLOT|nr:hypothetical protein [Clostridium argentinense]KIE44304.1 hypothetical protein U732_462 [Clostridium argentinense CDC 2741]
MSENNKFTQEVNAEKKSNNNNSKRPEKNCSDNCGKIVVYTDVVNININCCKNS